MDIWQAPGTLQWHWLQSPPRRQMSVMPVMRGMRVLNGHTRVIYSSQRYVQCTVMAQ